MKIKRVTLLQPYRILKRYESMKKLLVILLTLATISWFMNEFSLFRSQRISQKQIPQSKRSVCANDTLDAYAVFWEKIFLTHDQVWNEYQNNHMATIAISTII